MLIPLLLQADNAYLLRHDETQARRALAGYRELYGASPGVSDYAWRLSMAAYFVGMRYETTDEKKVALFEEGRDAGRTCLKLAPENPACHFWTAVNLALYGNTLGPFKTLSIIPEVRRLLQETRELDPKFAYGGAQRVLGLISQKLPGILGGSNSTAKEFFEQAIAIIPDEPMNYLFLARLLHEEMEDTPAALEAVEKGLTLGPFPVDRLESRESMRELEELRTTLRGRSLAGTPTESRELEN